jgi:hypothetical protein
MDQSQLDQLFQVTDSTGRFDKMLGQVTARHGEKANTLPDIFSEQNRIDEIVRRRAFIIDPEHKFFLALLLNVQEKERILSLVQARFPDADPIDKILDWSLELAETKVLGLNLPNALGIEDFDDHDLFLLENIIKGLSEEEIEQAARDTYPAAAADQILAAMPVRRQKLNESLLLLPLLQ